MKASIWKWSMFVCLPLWTPDTRAAQFVEVVAEIEGTFWPEQGTESRRNYSTRCVIGTNSWMIEGDFQRNGTTTYWFTGTNLIQHTVITKKLPDSQQGDRPARLARMPEIGERFTTVRSLSDGGPTDGGGYENVLWLAYCSGRFLKEDGRLISLPIGVNPRAGYAQNFSQAISVFEDGLSLPKLVELQKPDNHLLCHYEVQESTNVAGWILPQRFQAIQYRPGTNGTWKPHAQAVGRLISARTVGEPEIPTDVLKQIRQ